MFEGVHNYNAVKRSRHSEHPVYQKIHPINFHLELSTVEHDPITGYAYSLPNNIIVFEIENRCICGEPVRPITEITLALELAEQPQLVGIECILLGYPGGISSSHPIKPKLVDDEELSSKKN